MGGETILRPCLSDSNFQCSMAPFASKHESLAVESLRIRELVSYTKDRHQYHQGGDI
uniref:Uncharacterized protein n=1 Tax=Arundo donax TaxID=35708 RepID=A0A0A9EBS3_ARUDO